MMKDVPIVGWDVTFTPKGIFLLEVNLSCNFFRGSFDIPRYIALVDAYWKHIEELEVAIAAGAGAGVAGGGGSGARWAPVAATPPTADKRKVN
jgi:hypothetical protein